jgi:hypothetical protein
VQGRGGDTFMPQKRDGKITPSLCGHCFVVA